MSIRQQLINLSENDLRKKVIIPTLEALSAYGTEDFHGAREKGKDVYFSYNNIFGRFKHCCFFIKKGDIYKRPGTNDIRKMKEQIEEAYKREFTSPIDNKTPIHIEEFYFVCSGKINKEARDWLSELLRNGQMPNFDIFDIDNLIQFILDLVKKCNYLMGGDQYTFKIQTFNQFCKKIVDHNQRQYTLSVVSLSEQSEGKKIGNNYG